MDVSVRLTRQKINHRHPEPSHLVVRVAGPMPHAMQPMPKDIVLVADTSSSMSEAADHRPGSPSKCDAAREAMLRFLLQLDDHDRVGLVAFSDSAHVFTPIGALRTNRAMLEQGIRRIGAHSGTNLVGGVSEAIGMLAEETQPGDELRTQRIILFTDGQPTVGITDHDDVCKAIRERRRETMTDAPIATFGFGPVGDLRGRSGYDPELLEAIATLSGGASYHAEGADALIHAFAMELGFLRSLTATNVRVRITAHDPFHIVVLENVPIIAAGQNGNDVTLAIGNLYDGKPVSVTAALQVPSVDKVFPRPTAAATVRVTGQRVDGTPFDISSEVRFRYVAPNDAEQRPDPQTELDRLQIAAGIAIREAWRYARQGRFTDAAQRILAIREELKRIDLPEAKERVAELERIGSDLGDRQRFAEQAGHLRDAGQTYMTGYGGGRSDYTSLGMPTTAQRGAYDDMTMLGNLRQEDFDALRQAGVDAAHIIIDGDQLRVSNTAELRRRPSVVQRLRDALGNRGGNRGTGT
ncbi:VWA domain-containing protein [Candidatus Uhrbacteria bacterium]|nr:VWA domain-containing protein [Candidatus Uhrbacteria bacterium]